MIEYEQWGEGGGKAIRFQFHFWFMLGRFLPRCVTLSFFFLFAPVLLADWRCCFHEGQANTDNEERQTRKHKPPSLITTIKDREEKAASFEEIANSPFYGREKGHFQWILLDLDNLCFLISFNWNCCVKNERNPRSCYKQMDHWSI